MEIVLSGCEGLWPRYAACGILVPRPGMEPVPLQWKHGVLTTGPPGKSLKVYLTESLRFNNNASRAITSSYTTFMGTSKGSSILKDTP